MENSKSKMKHNLLPQKIINDWPSQFDGHLHYCIGLSGGVDSVVLLDLLIKAQQVKLFQLSAIHVNHNISPNAQLWQQFCIELCQKYFINLISSSVYVQKIGGEGLENSARKLRYQEYAKTDADVIILAHHQDDQIETMLSQIMRGSNLHNSAGMLPVNQRGQQYFWRPLLDVSKLAINDYAMQNQLQHIEDESNNDNQYLRNFLRNQIIPQLEKFDPQVKTKLCKTVSELQNITALSDELAQLDYTTCATEIQALHRQEFINLSPLRQQNLLAYYIQQQNIALPSQKRIIEFIRQVQSFKNGRKPTLILNQSHTLIATFKLISIIKNKESLD